MTDKAVLEALVETNKVLTAAVAEQSSTVDRLTKENAQVRRKVCLKFKERNFPGMHT